MYSLDYEKGINNYSLESEMKKIIRVLLKISIVNDKILNNRLCRKPCIERNMSNNPNIVLLQREIFYFNIFLSSS